MATIDEQIENLTAILQRGVTTISKNGTTQVIDLAEVRQERDRLLTQRNANSRGSRIRKVTYNPNWPL